MKSLFTALFCFVIVFTTHAEGSGKDMPALIPFSKNGKWGIKTREDRIVIPAEYAYPFRILKDGTLLTPTSDPAHYYNVFDATGYKAFDSIRLAPDLYFGPGILIFEQESSPSKSIMGLISLSGDTLFPARFYSIEYPTPWLRLARLSNRNEYWLLNTAGHFFGHFQDTIARPFDCTRKMEERSDEAFRFMTRGGCRYAFPEDYVSKEDYANGLPYAEGVAFVKPVDGSDTSGKLYGLIDKKGNWLLTPQFSYGTCFSEGWAAVVKDNKHYYIDPSGKKMLELPYDWLGEFHEGYAEVTHQGKSSFIDKHGHLITPMRCRYLLVTPFRHGLAVINEKFLLDSSGRHLTIPDKISVRRLGKGFEIRKAQGGDTINEWWNESLTEKWLSGNWQGLEEDSFVLITSSEGIGLYTTNGKEILPCSAARLFFHDGYAAPWLVQDKETRGYFYVDGEGRVYR